MAVRPLKFSILPIEGRGYFRPYNMVLVSAPFYLLVEIPAYFYAVYFVKSYIGSASTFGANTLAEMSRHYLSSVILPSELATSGRTTSQSFPRKSATSAIIFPSSSIGTSTSTV